jgi:hypothetical protein
MEIQISHREDLPQTGFSVQVQFANPRIPALKLVAPTRGGLQIILDHLLTGVHSGSPGSHLFCAICRRIAPPQ